jgi:hypothetical protein
MATAMIAQQTAIAKETGHQIRSFFEREAMLAIVPTAKNPVNTHIPALPIRGTQGGCEYSR